MNEREKAVLYVLLESPALLERVTIDPAIFKGRAKDIFDELQRQFVKSQSFSWEEAADKLKLKISFLHTLFDGCYRFDVARLEATLKQIEAEALGRKIIVLLKQEMEVELKTGTINDAKIAEIERMFKKRAELNDSTCKATVYDDVRAKSVAWLWPGRIPLGMITLVAGHPGTGKSFFATWLAAKLSRGKRLPGGATIKPCSTLLIAAEDDPEQTIKPRLEGNEADSSRIIAFAEPMRFSLDRMRMLERELDRRPDIRLIVLDPLTAFLGSKVDYFKDPDVRLKLIPLKELAQERRIAVLGVVHFNKKEDAELITRIGGSMAFAGVARSVLGISHDNRETDEDNRDTRLLSSLKMNLARKPDTLAFKINSTLKIDFDPTPVLLDADVLFSKESRERKAKQSLTDTWLIDYLAQHPNSISRDVKQAATEENIHPSTLYRAKSKLERQGLLIITETGFGKDHKSYWTLK